MQRKLCEQRITRVRALLLYRAQLLDLGQSDRSIDTALKRGHLVRVVRGVFMLQENWSPLFPEERLLARTIAIAEQNRGRTVLFSHFSAAAIWNLPLWMLRDHRVHLLTSTNPRIRNSANIYRHHASWEATEICEVAGLRVTSLSKTVTDIARWAGPELAIGIADAGMRAMFGSNHRGVSHEAFEWRGSQLDWLDSKRGERGVRKARRILRFADPRADSVVESVSRLQFSRLQMEVEIQVPVRGSAGQQYRLDFEFVGQRAFGEIDGAVKYTDPGVLRGRTADQAVLIEKRREDDIRGVEDKRIVRWMPESIATPELLGHRMRAFGLRVPAMD